MAARRWMRAWLLCGLALATCPSPARAAGDGDTWAAVVLPTARQLDIRASGTGHPYRLFVQEPAAPAPAEGRPVLYVLDGNAAFPVAAFLARSAEGRREVTGQVPPLVVGIGYPGDDDFHVAARRRDYTPGAPDTERSATEGCAERFLDFIEQEVKPLIEARYPVDRTRQALFGHSFGGLFVLHALFTRPASFSTFIASSPSIWWQDRRVLDGLPKLAQAGVSPRVQISVGAREDDPPKGNYPPDMLALIATRTMIPEARDAAAQLRSLPGWNARVAYHELAGEDHGPAWMPAMTRGMQLFLEHAR